MTGGLRPASAVRTRRDLLRAGAAFAALATLPGCGKLARLVPGGPDDTGPVELPSADAVDPHFLLLARAGGGARPGETERVRAVGATAWLAAQLRPGDIDDAACDLRASTCETVFDEPMDLRSVAPAAVERDVVRHRLLRAVHSERRVLESMVGFWSDHFSIQLQKKGCRETKAWDDREVVRRHALGRFRDLLGASARSPAMLRYLDNAENRRASATDRPNENYARELLELHTLGVHGGYTQRDVMEAARCLTGWTLRDDPGIAHAFREVNALLNPSAHDAASRADVWFRPDWHDDGEKTVLGVRIAAGGGAKDLDDLLDVVSRHPSTARHLATKLCRHFLEDPAPESAVDRVAATFTETDGDLAAVTRAVFDGPELAASAGRKVKRPFEFVVSALRALDADSEATPDELRFLERLGHVPFHYPTPDGYPEEPEPWMGTLLWRWNFALALTTNRLGATKTDLPALAGRCGLDARRASPADLAPLLYGRRATGAERLAVETYAARAGGTEADRRAEAVALLLCAPPFQVS